MLYQNNICANEIVVLAAFSVKSETDFVIQKIVFLSGKNLLSNLSKGYKKKKV